MPSELRPTTRFERPPEGSARRFPLPHESPIIQNRMIYELHYRTIICVVSRCAPSVNSKSGKGLRASATLFQNTVPLERAYSIESPDHMIA